MTKGLFPGLHSSVLPGFCSQLLKQHQGYTEYLEFFSLFAFFLPHFLIDK